MGHLLKLKCVYSVPFTLESTHFIFDKCPFTLTTVQVLNLALTHTIPVTVYCTALAYLLYLQYLLT
jgi:hypothetical protein